MTDGFRFSEKERTCQDLEGYETRTWKEKEPETSQILVEGRQEVRKSNLNKKFIKFQVDLQIWIDTK